MQTSTGILRPAFDLSTTPKSLQKDFTANNTTLEPTLVSYGQAYDQAVPRHLDEVLNASRTYALVSRSLANNTDRFERLKTALGDRLVGVRVGMKPHTFISECVEVILECRKLEADSIITLGGGSLSDAAKVVSFGLSNNVTSAETLLKLPHVLKPDSPAVPSKLPIIVVPTTLSGGEFTPYAGVTDDVDNVKYQFTPPLRAPAIVVLDGEVAVTTPLHTWLSTGIRAVDHCVESLLSIHPSTRVQESDEAATEGLKCLVPGLLKTKHDPSSIDARHTCQLGTPHSVTPLLLGVWVGASHGIGHMLGPLGVGHGETSCVLMPSVHKWNAAHGADMERQKVVRSTLWDIDVAKKVFEARGLSPSKSDLGDLLDAFLRELGMPRSLAEVGVKEEQFASIAKNSMKDVFLPTNPVPIHETGPVLEILEMCK